MQDPAVPVDELARLDVLAGCRIVDTPPEASFDDIARLAAQICEAPIALVSLVTSDRQWFKARVGMQVEQTSRRIAFSLDHRVAAEASVVEGVRNDERPRGSCARRASSAASPAATWCACSTSATWSPSRAGCPSS